MRRRPRRQIRPGAGQFAYNADTAVKTLSLTLDGFAAARFAVDNFAYVNPAAVSVQPLTSHGRLTWQVGNTLTSRG